MPTEITELRGPRSCVLLLDGVDGLDGVQVEVVAVEDWPPAVHDAWYPVPAGLALMRR